MDSMGRQTKSNSKVLDLVLGEDSFPPVLPQIMLTTKFLVYSFVARQLLASNSSIQFQNAAPKPEMSFDYAEKKQCCHAGIIGLAQFLN